MSSHWNRCLVVACFGLAAAWVGPARAADNYSVDAVHSSVSFKARHMGLSWVHGRFNEFSGSFAIDKQTPSKSKFSLSIKVDSVDTNNKQRDDHLRSPDYFNAKQFATITFESTAVKAVKDGYEVTGDLTLHGVTKPVTFTLEGGSEAEFPKGVKRTGFSTDLTIKRSDYGMKTMLEALGDEVRVSIGLEGVAK